MQDSNLIDGGFRGYTPTAGEEGEGNYGGLAASSMGDWCWHPGRAELKSPAMFRALGIALAERPYYGPTQVQGNPRPTTHMTPCGKILQVYIPGHKQALKTQSGNAPSGYGNPMGRIWDQINEK